ncbi:MAG TPA: glycoside hydrolase family 16 protein [Mycobacterium sp.]|nr:glycoside hydrolase family 16 protein [Mycobacterium sp.]
MNRRAMMMMTGIAAMAAAVPLPRALADTETPGEPGVLDNPEPGNIIFADDFDGPPGASPDRSKWFVKNFNEPVNPPILGLYRDDPRNVSLDGNGNLALRATQEGANYFTGRVESRAKIGINHTWEARVKLPMQPGLWPAYWLVNIEDTPDGRGPLPDGEVDIVEWYGNGKWAPGTSVHARSDGKTWREHRWPVDDAWHTYRVRWDDAGFRFWMDDFTVPPYFSVPAAPIQGAWPFNDPGYLLFTMLNLAVGGPGGGDPNFGAVSDPMLVDYVRVW